MAPRVAGIRRCFRGISNSSKEEFMLSDTSISDEDIKDRTTCRSKACGSGSIFGECDRMSKRYCGKGTDDDMLSPESMV